MSKILTKPEINSKFKNINMSNAAFERFMI
jgi:hypothetical protein